MCAYQRSHRPLAYSNWEWVTITYSETFETLVEGLQASLWELGAVPGEHRPDNLSAATHDLKRERGRALNERYLEVLRHYGMEGSKNTPGNAHENGDVESSERIGIVLAPCEQSICGKTVGAAGE